MDDSVMKLTSTDILCCYCERMSLYSYDVKECQVLIKKYISDHEDAVMRHVKDILDGKHELCFILGLRPLQRKEAVLTMGSYICAVKKNDMDYFDKIIDAFNKGKKNKPLEKIHVEFLKSLCSRVVAENNVYLVSEAFSNNSVNTPSRAFLLAVAICKYDLMDNPKAELVFIAAYLAVSYHKSVINGFIRRYDTFMTYLNQNSTRNIFTQSTLGQLFEDDMMFLRDSDWIKQQGLDFGSYDFRKHVDMMTISTVFSSYGLLQEHSMESVSFSKAKKEELAHQAYIACMFDGMDFPFNEIAQAMMDGDVSAIKPEDITRFNKAVSEFELALRRIVYINYLAVIYKKVVCSAIFADIFNLDEKKTHRKLLNVQKQLEQCHEKEAHQKALIKQLQSENSDISRQLTESKNKYAGLQDKIDKQAAEIEVLKQKISLLEEDKRKAEQSLSALLPEEEPAVDDTPEIAIDYSSLLQNILKNHKVVFVGGNENIMSKFSQSYPQAVVIPKSRIASSDSLIETADIILFKTDSMGHKDYYKVKQIAIRKKIPYDYLGDIANLQRFVQNVYETLCDMGFGE